MHNLSTVIQFEIVRTLKKKSFWIMSLMFPVSIAAVFGLIYFSNQATSQAATDASKESFSIVLTDKSGLINPALIEGFKAKTVETSTQGQAAVKSGKVDAYFYYPKNVNDGVEVYAKDVGLFDNSRYQAVAKLLLTQSVTPEVDSATTAVLKDEVKFNQTTYRDGEVYDGIKQMIAPGIFLVLFYLLIATFGNQMLTSTTEEKENRVIEMILTTVEARTLVVGKILSLISLGFLQATLVIVPVITAYLLLRDKLALPDIDITSLPLDPARIAVAAGLFIVSFLLFTGILVTIGAATPTAKEAGGFFGVVMILIFGPLYAAPLFVSSPDSPLVQFLSYFPPTAPIPLMLRNAVGNLEYWQAGLASMLLLIMTVIILMIAVRVFRQGALEYNRKLSFKEIFARS